MKGIKISTKISALVILISLVAVGAISFFTYDFNLKTNREKIANNLNVITENRAAIVNTYFDKIKYDLALLQAAKELTGQSDSSAAPADDFGAMFDMGGEASSDSSSEAAPASP